jgi:DNA-binding NarL/FixJ family response regulator
MTTKIGIVDDHRLIVRSLSLLIETFDGFEVILEAFNGQELQSRLKTLNGPPEVMLVDVNMPVMNGPEITKWLKDHYPTMKIIALSVNAQEQAVIDMIRAGCCAYLLKDAQPSELEKALLEVAEQGYYNGDFSNVNYRRLLQYEQNKISLTDREKTFLQLACSDLTYRQIADKMCLSERTIDGYRESLFQKLKVESRVGMALEAVRRELVSLADKSV